MCCMYQRGRLFVFFFTVVAMKKHLSSQREGCHLMKSPNFCVKVLGAFEITQLKVDLPEYGARLYVRDSLFSDTSESCMYVDDRLQNTA